MRSLLIALVLIPVLSLAALAQQVLVIDAANGPGADFTDLQPALDAAADGDLLLVRAGAYGGASVVGKALTLTADIDGAEVVTVSGSLRVEGLPPNTTFVLEGIDVTGVAGASQNALEAELCAGTLWVESCELQGSDAGPGFGRDGAVLIDCDDVVFVRCELRGGVKSSFPKHQGAEGLTATGTAIWAFESSFTGAPGGWADDIGGIGRAGASISEGSSLFATACTFVGGDGGGADDDYDMGCECVICGVPGFGGDGLFAWNSDVTVQASSFSAGQGGVSTSAKGCPDGADGQPVGSFGMTSVTQLAGATRGLRITPVVREGESMQLIVFGQEGELVWWLLGFDTRVNWLPAKLAPLLVGLPFALAAPLVTLPPGGVLPLSFTAPDLPVGLEGVLLVSQAYFSAPGAGQLSNGTATLLIDGSF